MNEVKIFVRGMNCDHCKMRVQDHLQQLKGINHVIADVDSQVVSMEGDDIDLDKVKAAVEEIGYHYDGELL